MTKILIIGDHKSTKLLDMLNKHNNDVIIVDNNNLKDNQKQISTDENLFFPQDVFIKNLDDHIYKCSNLKNIQFINRESWRGSGKKRKKKQK